LFCWAVTQDARNSEFADVLRIHAAEVIERELFGTAQIRTVMEIAVCSDRGRAACQGSTTEMAKPS
jgi:hypothetical protein